MSDWYTAAYAKPKRRKPMIEITFKIKWDNRGWIPWCTGFNHGTFNCGWGIFWIHSQYYWK